MLFLLSEVSESAGSHTESGETDAGEEFYVKTGYIAVLALLIVYTVSGSFIEFTKFSYIHETGIAIILGMVISVGASLIGLAELNDMLQFNESLFFYMWLPPIVFAAGYNMKRKKFFQHFNYIALFGILGTLVIFISFTILTELLFYTMSLNKYVPSTGATEEFTLTDKEILLFCSCMSSSDIIAALSIVTFEKTPKLYSIVLGEGIINDAVAIILFNTVFKYTKPTENFTAKTIFKVMMEFTKLSISSVVCGLIAAFSWALFLKYMRFLTHSPVQETMLVFWFGYLGYMVSETLHLSGILALLTSGVLMAHYTWYNLSPQSKTTTNLAFSAIGFGAEAFVFAYLGLTFFSYHSYEYSLQFFVSELWIIITGRFIGVIGLLYTLSFVFGHKRQLDFKEALFFCCGGMIRGAIAFGLVLRLDDTLPNREVIITTSLFLVIISTLLFGSILPLIGKFLLYTKDDSQAIAHIYPVRKSTELKDVSKNNSRDIENSASHYEMLVHPNFEDNEQSATIEPKKKKNIWVEYFKKFDENILKPALIYKYNKEKKERQWEFFDLLRQRGQNIEKVYVNRSESLDLKDENSVENLLLEVVRKYSSKQDS